MLIREVLRKVLHENSSILTSLIDVFADDSAHESHVTEHVAHAFLALDRQAFAVLLGQFHRVLGGALRVGEARKGK